MSKLQLVRLGYPQKGDLMRDQMAEFFVTDTGDPAMRFHWDRIFFPKREVFIFKTGTVAARVATEDEMRTQAKLGAFGMKSSAFLPLGLVGGLAAGAIAGLTQSVDGMSAVVVGYTNPQGFTGFIMVIATAPIIAQICQAIPNEKFECIQGG